MKIKVRFITQAAVIGAAYLVLTLPFAQIAFGGPIQFRLSEALTVLAALTPAAIPGLFVGCLLANIFNPQSLGLIDIIFGSMATLLAAWLTWYMQKAFRPGKGKLFRTIAVISPSVIINALVVGFYLPFLLPGQEISVLLILGFMLSILISQAIVVYVIGMPFYFALLKTKIFSTSVQVDSQPDQTTRR